MTTLKPVIEILGKKYYVSMTTMVSLILFLIACLCFIIASMYAVGNAIGIGGITFLFLVFILLSEVTINGVKYTIIPPSVFKNFVSSFITGACVIYYIIQLLS